MKKLTDDQVYNVFNSICSGDWCWISEICLGFDIDTLFTRQEKDNNTSANAFDWYCKQALFCLNDESKFINWLKKYGLEKHLKEKDKGVGDSLGYVKDKIANRVRPHLPKKLKKYLTKMEKLYGDKFL